MALEIEPKIMAKCHDCDSDLKIRQVQCDTWGSIILQIEKCEKCTTDAENNGHDGGFDSGKEDGDKEGYERGYEEGKRDGDKEGYERGFREGETNAEERHG